MTESHRREAICRNCGTAIVYYGGLHKRWVHSELEFEFTAGHTPEPSPFVSSVGEVETQGASA